MRGLLFAFGALVVATIILLWPPAAVHVQISADSQDRTATILAGMSDVRMAIFAVAFLAFIAALAYAIISALRHRT